MQQILDQQAALQSEVNAQMALNRILKAQLSQVDEKLIQCDKATMDLKNELADKSHLLSAAQRKLIESKNGGQLQTQGSLHGGLLKQDSILALQGRSSGDSIAIEDAQQLAKRTAELDREREANHLLQRYVAAKDHPHGARDPTWEGMALYIMLVNT